MFRSLTGYKADYQDLTMLVVSEFNEWKVLVHGPHTIIHGTRQFSEAKAKEHAMTVARSFVHDRQHEELPEAVEPSWQPAAADDWLVWS
jgi:hypothetical protein